MPRNTTSSGLESAHESPDSRERAHPSGERELRTIVDALPALVALVGADARYRFVSSAYERWFGRATPEIVGRHMRDVLGPAAFDEIEPYVARVLSGERVRYEAELSYRDAGPRSVEATYVPLTGQDGSIDGFIAMVTDRTEHKSLEHYRRAAVERSERLSKITAAIADAVSGEQVFEATVDHVAAAIEASSAALWLVDAHARSARLVRSVGYEAGAQKALARLDLDSSSRSPVLDAIAQGQPVFVSSQAELFRSYPDLGTVATPGRKYRVACLPLMTHGEVLGALGITIEHEGTPAAEEREFLLLVARYASQAIERLRAFEAERNSRAQAELLYEFAQAVVVAERVDQVFEVALNVIERVMATERAAILIRDDHGVMRFRAWRGLSDAYRSAVEGHSPWSDAAPTFEPILVPDAAVDPTLADYAELFRSEGIGALAFVPLVNGGRLVGKFMVYHDRPHGYSQAEIATCRAVANHVASVAVRFSLIAKLQEAIRVSELFAGVLAHDLRNPLGAIMTAAQLVLMRQEGEGETTGRHAKPLSRILTSGQRMSRMIDQLLDFTVARTGGGIKIQPRATNLAELCTQAIGELELVHPE